MRDQYGNAVPADLVVLPDFWLLTKDQVEIVDKMDWYECMGVLLVSQSDLGGDDPREVGLEVDPDGNLTGRVKKIDQDSHRWNEQDGFYYV
jgi:autonomous glycyl radical cofactor GrcA